MKNSPASTQPATARYGPDIDQGQPEPTSRLALFFRRLLPGPLVGPIVAISGMSGARPNCGGAGHDCLHV